MRQNNRRDCLRNAPVRAAELVTATWILSTWRPCWLSAERRAVELWLVPPLDAAAGCRSIVYGRRSASVPVTYERTSEWAVRADLTFVAPHALFSICPRSASAIGAKTSAFFALTAANASCASSMSVSSAFVG